MSLDQARTRQALDIAFELRDTPADLRPAEIRRRCQGDTALAQEVASLLDVADQPDHAFDNGAAQWLRETERDRPPPTIPGYEIESELGRGGMGTVYLATDRSHADRPVALKILPPLTTELARARFADECYAMANLVHPNIAMLYQTGIAAEQPFMAMEYVAGPPIDRYCDQHRLTLRQRVNLVLQLCRAVAYAHESGVLHQDLKPANILVSEQTAEPNVKVIDFGIATLLQSAQAVTPGRSAAGTPAYTSPERQREPTSFRADTREDVYAIGVVLFELLAGARPSDVTKATPQAGTVPLVAGINHQTDEDIAALAHHRQTQLHRWRGALAGDLAAITAKALATDRERRYRSPLELHDDLLAWLQRRPVSARPLSWLYQSRLFLVRRWFPLTSAAAIVLALTIGLVASLNQAAKARLAQQEAEQVTDFVRQLFANADASVANPQALTALDVLETGWQTAEDELAEQPTVLARVLEVIGTSLLSLGELERAQMALETALTKGGSALSAEHEASIWLALGDTHRKRAQYDDADTALARAQQLYTDRGRDNTAELANVLNARANVLFSRRDFSGAKALHQQALDLRTSTLGSQALETGVSANNVAAMNLMLRDHTAAEPYLRQALQVFEAQLPPTHAWIDQVSTNLATSLGRQRRYPESITIQNSILARQITRLGEQHPDVVITLTNLADAHRLNGALAASEAALDRADAIAAQLYEPTHPHRARIAARWGALMLAKGDFDRAAERYTQGLNLYRDHYGPRHSTVAHQLRHLGLVAAARGAQRMAADYFDRAHAIWSETDNAERWLLDLDRDRLRLALDHGQAVDAFADLFSRHLDNASMRPDERAQAAILHARYLSTYDPSAALALLTTTLNDDNALVGSFTLARGWAAAAQIHQQTKDANRAAVAASRALSLLRTDLPRDRRLADRLRSIVAPETDAT